MTHMILNTKSKKKLLTSISVFSTAWLKASSPEIADWYMLSSMATRFAES